MLPVAVVRYNLTKKIASHVRPGRRRTPPPGGCLHRQHLRSTKKDLAGRYYQFPSGHGSFGSYLKRMKKVDSDWCWFCSIGERQSRFRPVTRCPARHESWKRIWRLCDKRGSEVPPVGDFRGQQSDARGLVFLDGHEGGKDGFVGSSGGWLVGSVRNFWCGFPLGCWGPYYDRFCRSAVGKNGYVGSLPPWLRQRDSK